MTMENEKNNSDSIENMTEHLFDDAQSMASMDTCNMAETPGALSISPAEELSIESNEGDLLINEKVIQGHDMEGSTEHALCALDGTMAPCVDVEVHAMVEPRNVQNAASTNISSMAETLVAFCAINTDNLSIERNGCEKDDHQLDDLSEDKKALQFHGLDSSTIECGVLEDNDSSHIAFTDKDALQMHDIGRNFIACGVTGDAESSNFAAKDSCIYAKTLVEQSCLISNAMKIDDNSPSSNEENEHTCDDLPCCEAILNQENMSSIHMETELYGNVDGSLINGELMESQNPDFETRGLGEDKEHKAGFKNPLPKASGKVEHACQCQISDVTDCRGTFSHAESCEQGNSRLENVISEAGDSCSPAVCLKPEVIQDENAKHNLLAVSENTSACQKVSDSGGGPNALLSQAGEEHSNDCCISSSLLIKEDKAMNIAQVNESGDLMNRQEICDHIPEVCLMELQDKAVDVKSITNGSLESLTCVLDTVKISNLAHKESGAGDEDCPLAAGQDPPMKCFSASPSIRCSVAQVKDMDGNDLHAQCSEGSTLVSMVFGVCQTEEGTTSNESQPHGYTVDKDGGSSMDSTAGSEWKLQGTEGYIAAEDEEASNTGGEDSASSPACLQPSTQQRKKININHQFVREIVKIQHDREQYDREQVERQIQAHQAATSAQLGGKSLDSKGHKIHLSDSKQLRSELNKTSSRKGLKDHGDDRQMDSQPKLASRNNKDLSIQAKEGSSHQNTASQENSEHVKQIYLPGRDLLGTKEHGKAGRGRQQRSMSIYRPPVVRESLTAGELETSYHQSGTYVMNSSPDSSTSSVSEPHVSSVGSPNLFDNEGIPKVAKSSSGESYAHNRETQTDQCKPGMGIKVTFDTERKQRHIEFSDLPRGHRQKDLAVSHNSSGFGMSKSPIINPLLSHSSQESKLSYIDRRQAGIGEAASKANDRYYTRVDRSTSIQGSSPEFSQFRGKMGKASDNNLERRNSFFEQADNSVILHNSSARLHKAPSLTHHGNNGSPNIYNDNARQAEGHAGDMRTPSALLQGFSSRKSSSLGPSYKGELLGATSYSYMRNDEPNRTPGNFQVSLQDQQFNVSRSKQDLRGKQRLAISSEGSKKKRDLQLPNSIKDAGSPFQAMMKDINRPQVTFSSPAPQSLGDASLDIQGFGMSWDMKDRVHARNQDSSYEGLKRTQSDASRKGSAQNLQALSSPLPSRESFFSTMPMQEKWGDIVDDQYDLYDYLQVKHEGERESRSGSLSYGVQAQSSAAFVDAASLKPEKQPLRDSKQNRTLRKYGHSETGNVQRNKAASEFVQDRSSYETPVRKSVFERLGPQSTFKESILGPPPKVLDSRGVLKASPDAIISNTAPVSTFRSFDTGYHGSQQAAHLSGMLHNTGDNIIDEGREVVVQAYTELKQRRSKRELYVPRRGS